MTNAQTKFDISAFGGCHLNLLQSEKEFPAGKPELNVNQVVFNRRGLLRLQTFYVLLLVYLLLLYLCVVSLLSRNLFIFLYDSY